MKLYEALTELKHNRQGYVVQVYRSKYARVLQFDTEGVIRDTYLCEAVAGNQGRRLSFIYHNADSTDKLLRLEEFTYISDYKELCLYYFNYLITQEQRLPTTQEIASALKHALRKRVTHLKETEELLATWIKLSVERNSNNV